MLKRIQFLLMLVSLATVSVALGDDPGDSYSGGSSEREEQGQTRELLNIARSSIEGMKYKRAIREAYAVIRIDGRNSDAWNLIGYSNRKLGKYKKAAKAYRKALKYDPTHKGALEYQGELFISLGQYEKALDNRNRLAQLCPDGCEQLTDLELALSAVN
ncbi:MAG: tetratricopeptide repeat protein [Granulosicoccus sp.]|nr:tetratricopeptide repeat protein [Granulosicoccus sp.]